MAEIIKHVSLKTSLRKMRYEITKKKKNKIILNDRRSVGKTF